MAASITSQPSQGCLLPLPGTKALLGPFFCSADVSLSLCLSVCPLSVCLSLSLSNSLFLPLCDLLLAANCHLSSLTCPSGSLLSGAKLAASATSGLAGEREGRHGERQQLREDGMKSSVSAQSEPSIGKAGRGRWQTVQSHLAAGKLSLSK